MPDYRIGKLNGRYVLTWWEGKKRHRYRLDAKDARGAAIEAPGIYATLTRPKGSSVEVIWNAYMQDRAGRAIVANMPHNWTALRERFAPMQAETIMVEDCRAHTAERRRAGIKDGTIATELGRLRMVLRWGEKRGLIARAPTIERPTPPKRTERHLTRKQCSALIAAAAMPHVRLFIILALATGGRRAALLELTWDRCDFDRGQINLRNPAITRPHKGRAIVPMNRTLRAALLEAKAGALSEHVIEWAGESVLSVKRGLKSAAKAVGVRMAVAHHLFRHSAAVHMAEAGISMEEIAQYLGQEDVSTTREVYARFSPSHLRKAAAVLEYDDLGSTRPESTSFSGQNEGKMQANPLEYMVGATGIEPVTPTMSTKRAGRK